MARSSRNKSSSLADRFDAFRASLRAGADRASLITCGLVLLGCVALLAWGVPRLRARLDAQALASGNTSEVDFRDAPAWFDARRRAEVSEKVSMAVGYGSVLDPHRLAKAKAALMTTGWFKSVEQVRLADDGGFLVEATFVRPFAVVRHGEFDFLVDDQGCLLPMQWTAGHRPAEPHYIAIVGTSEPNRGDFGTPWPGADLAAGLELAKTLLDRPWRTEVAAIDVSSFRNDATLTLITRNDGRVLWGRAPGDRSVAEVTPDSKLSTLDHLYATSGRIDSGGGRIIDVRGDLVTVRGTASAEAQ